MSGRLLNDISVEMNVYQLSLTSLQNMRFVLILLNGSSWIVL